MRQLSLHSQVTKTLRDAMLVGLLLLMPVACGGTVPAEVDHVWPTFETVAEEVGVEAEEWPTEEPSIPPTTEPEEEVDAEPTDIETEMTAVAELTSEVPTQVPTSTPVEVTTEPTLEPIPDPTPTADFGSVAYDVPTQMTRDDETQVILLVSPSEDGNLEAALVQELHGVGQEPTNVVTASVETARQMSATLTGVPASAFEIVPLQSSDVQLLQENRPTQWEWTVVPKEGGTHMLLLRIEKLLEQDGQAFLIKQEVYRDEVLVETPLALLVKDASGFLSFVGVMSAILLGGIILLRRTVFVSGNSRQSEATSNDWGLSRAYQKVTLSYIELQRLVPIVSSSLEHLGPDGRRSLLVMAGVGDLVSVDVNGSAEDVATRLLVRLNYFGQTEDGDIAIARLLRHLAREDGPLPISDRRHIETVLASISFDNKSVRDREDGDSDSAGRYSDSVNE